MSDPLRLLMMGTGRFAVPVFQGLLSGRHSVVGLVTQPDRVARGGRRHVNPMKQLAEQHELEVFQPARVNDADSVARLREYDADLAVVAAYGQILSADVIGTPRLGAINVHASLLPRYRGAAPIQHAVMNGETETGVTVFQIEPRLDAGPILGMSRLEIGPRETYGELEERLSQLAVPLTMRVVDQIADGTAAALPQDTTAVTRAPGLKKEQGLIDWSRPARAIDCHIRGTQPWPRAFTYLHRSGHEPERILVLRADPASAVADQPAAPGTVRVHGGRLLVSCADCWLPLELIQPEGRRAMAVEEFLRGNSIPDESRFGPPDA